MSGRNKKTYYYAVRSGRNPGVFNTWEECQASTKGYQGAQFKKFATQEEAIAFSSNSSQQSNDSISYGRYQPAPTRRLSPEPAPVRKNSPVSHHSSEPQYSNLRYKPSNSARITPKIETNSARITPKIERSRDSDDEADERVYKQARYTSTSTYTSGPTFTKKKTTVVYTDGASSNNGKLNARAGYGVYWGDNDPRNVSARLPGERQTNQRAEASAVNHALEQSLQGNELLEIMTDSQYVIKAVTSWSKSWVANGWKSSSGGEVQNRDLFEKMLNLIEKRKGEVKFTYVPGHKGVDGNEKADRLAVEGAQK